MLGNVSEFVYRHRETNREKPVSRWLVAGPSEYWLLASSPASKERKKERKKKHNNAHTVQKNTYTRQLQQYTWPTNNYKQDNLKLATIHMRQIRILQHVQKIKTPKQESIDPGSMLVRWPLAFYQLHVQNLNKHFSLMHSEPITHRTHTVSCPI